MSLIEIDRKVFKRLLLYTRSLEDGVLNEEGLKGIRELRDKFDDGKSVDEQIDDFVKFSKQKYMNEDYAEDVFREIDKEIEVILNKYQKNMRYKYSAKFNEKKITLEIIE